MSQSGDGGYNGLKAFAFTVGVTVLIFTILYAARRYNPRLFAQEPSPRSRSWYLRGPNHPPDSDTRRPSLGERPRIWDARIASWYPPCSQPLSPSERLGPCQGQDENEKRDVNGAVDGEKKPQWAEFFVSRVLPHSINPLHPRIGHSCLLFWVPSHCLQTKYQTQILPLLHPSPRTITPSDPHHPPKFKLTPSSLCLPLLALRLYLQLLHQIPPHATPMIRQENTLLALPTSRTPRATNPHIANFGGTCRGIPASPRASHGFAQPALPLISFTPGYLILTPPHCWTRSGKNPAYLRLRQGEITHQPSQSIARYLSYHLSLTSPAPTDRASCRREGGPT